MASIIGGAEAIVIPEIETDPDELAAELREAYERGKAHALVVVAEGDLYNARAIDKHIAEYRGRIGFQLRVTTLGHVQRGGTPTFSIGCSPPGSVPLRQSTLTGVSMASWSGRGVRRW